MDVEANDRLSLSEVADEIIAIDLEMTDESLMRGGAGKVFYLKDYIILAEYHQILLFDKTGKFIRAIGRKGQGPEEYMSIGDIAFDEQEQCLYVADFGKILCYDLNGNCIKKRTFQKLQFPQQISYTNGRLSVINITFGNDNTDNGFVNRSVLYHIDNDLQIIDSLEIMKEFLQKWTITTNPQSHYITFDGKNTYLYYPALASKTMVTDTLYRFDGSELVPCLKVRFSDEGATRNGERTKNVMNIYKTQRFVFVRYYARLGILLFCYDSKTDKGYNMVDGFDDDIHHTGKADIRPLDLAAGTFYYLHTKEDESLKEEPNPTLYIGTLKK
ncbi:hypothetical protein AGMMS50239_24220 [Bacteroidia bacterium]|nr:hypothetical protein AGMMS50239_24220 [Bacteroidia bacterium]